MGKTKITIEAERVVVIRQHHSICPRWCDDCAAVVEMVTVEEAAAVVGVAVRVIHELAEAGKLHLVETPEGTCSVCLNSLIEGLTH